MFCNTFLLTLQKIGTFQQEVLIFGLLHVQYYRQFLLSVAPLRAGWDFSAKFVFNLVPTSEVQVIFAFTDGVGPLLRDSDHV